MDQLVRSPDVTTICPKLLDFVNDRFRLLLFLLLLGCWIIKAAGVGAVLLEKPPNQGSLDTELDGSIGVAALGAKDGLNNALHGHVADLTLVESLESLRRVRTREGDGIHVRLGPVLLSGVRPPQQALLLDLFDDHLVARFFLCQGLHPGALSVLPSELGDRVSSFQQLLLGQSGHRLLELEARTLPRLAIKVRPVAIGPVVSSPPLLDLKVLQVLVDVEGNDSGCIKLGATLDPRPVRWRADVRLVALMVGVLAGVGGVRAVPDPPVP